MGEDEGILRSNEGYIGTEEQWKDLEKREENRQDQFRDRRGRRSLKTITREVLRERDFSVEDLKRPIRSQPEARLRQKAMVAMDKEGHGPTEIVNFFGRDKGAVLYAVRKSRGKK